MDDVSTVQIPAQVGRRRLTIRNADAPAVTTGIDEVQRDEVQSTKVLRNGQLLIIRDGKTYNAQGILLNR